MVVGVHEHTLNVWMGGLLRGVYGLDAREERMQVGGRRIDVEVRVGPVKVAVEAEQGRNAGKRREAIGDADRRLEQGVADCAIAVCYPEGIGSEGEMAGCRLAWVIRAPNSLAAAEEARWTEGSLAELASVIKLAPMQLGDPDLAAAGLSASLDMAVGRLSEGQKREIARALDLPQSKRGTRLAGQPASRWNHAAKRAMLVVATAIMFHSRLDGYRDELRPELDNRLAEAMPFAGDWPPAMAQQCVGGTDPIGAFGRAWDLWLAVDYKPIFATALSALNGCPQDSAFAAAVRETGEAALALTRDISGLRHDLLGRIFHTVLDSARYDGSFYTTTAAATLLASLAIREDAVDWNDAEAIGGLRITDPACGTGTLLMAAAERIHDLAPGSRDDGRMARTLIERVLTGYDVNLTATHMAATTLGLLSPTTRFQNMKIGRAFLGVDGEGDAFLGSLEILDRQPRMMSWPGSARAVTQIDDESDMVRPDPSDIVIMNPPFTRDSLRHDQFSREDERKIKAKERLLFADAPTYMAGGSGAFLFLGEYLNRSEDGTLAAVLPLVGATDASGLGIRRYLASKYHVETIVTSHDPTRIYFSENTSIGEMLLVCRRWADSGGPKPPTRVVNLAVNPSTPAEAVSVARAIESGEVQRDGWGTVQEWPSERIADGDWGAVQFLSPYLCERFSELASGDLFRAVALGEIADVGPLGRRIRDAFTKTELPDVEGRIALWQNDTTFTQSMFAKPDTHIAAKRGKEHLADRYWGQRSRLLLPTRVRLTTARVTAALLDSPVVGSAWVPCKINIDENLETVEKALCAFLNSSVGVLSFLGNRTNRIPSYPNLSLDDLRKLVVPDFRVVGEDAVEVLAAVYDGYAGDALLPLPLMDSCEVRRGLDEAVCEALGLDGEFVGAVRRGLGTEPSVRGVRYGG